MLLCLVVLNMMVCVVVFGSFKRDGVCCWPGRAGRVSQGRAYFMVTQKFYEDCLDQHSIPEMQVRPKHTCSCTSMGKFAV